MIVIEFETKCAKYRRRAIKDAILFASNQLMSRIRKPVYINIRAIRKLAEKQGVYGDCMDEGDREFTIRIDVSLPFDEMITTILHEMVHVGNTSLNVWFKIGQMRYDLQNKFTVRSCHMIHARGRLKRIV